MRKHLPSGPQRSFLRCMVMGENDTLGVGLVGVPKFATVPLTKFPGQRKRVSRPLHLLAGLSR